MSSGELSFGERCTKALKYLTGIHNTLQDGTLSLEERQGLEQELQNAKISFQLLLRSAEQTSE